ncbi:hypothetical protein H5410_052125 [Solanum commersonii]|uniref:Uncharacterized protein n=1 Tax=Solanum commersonii TaxID=4109 RepID=A0A9J5X0I7_SOLCO|nr:hypothetical protein H5410_052125 [Solanum commersonii]
MDLCSTLTLSKLPPVTKVDTDVSSIPLIIVSSDDLCNDDTPSNYVEITTPNKGDVPNEGKVSDVPDGYNGSEGISSLQKWTLVRIIEGMEETAKSVVVIRGSFERVNVEKQFLILKN